MGTLSKLRRWVNRDDGRFYQVGNGPIGILTAVGALALVSALVLWQLHSHAGVNGAWAIATGLAGLVFLFFGARLGVNDNDT
jgi:hypothetical protein